jgi:hypothetical protein
MLNSFLLCFRWVHQARCVYIQWHLYRHQNCLLAFRITSYVHQLPFDSLSSMSTPATGHGHKTMTLVHKTTPNSFQVSHIFSVTFPGI